MGRGAELFYEELPIKARTSIQHGSYYCPNCRGILENFEKVNRKKPTEGRCFCGKHLFQFCICKELKSSGNIFMEHCRKCTKLKKWHKAPQVMKEKKQRKEEYNGKRVRFVESSRDRTSSIALKEQKEECVQKRGGEQGITASSNTLKQEERGYDHIVIESSDRFLENIKQEEIADEVLAIMLRDNSSNSFFPGMTDLSDVEFIDFLS